MSYEYIYSIENDFPNSKIDIESLIYEIRLSTITIAVDYVYNKDEIECRIYMKADLSEEEHATLDEIVANHEGDPLSISGVLSITSDRTQIVNDQMNPVDVDSEGRMKVLSYVTPKEHELSGPQHIGVLSDEQLPEDVTRHAELAALSGTLTDNMYDFAESYYDKSETDTLLLTKSPTSHQHDLRYYKRPEVDALIITKHGDLSGLSDDDHSQYFTTARGDVRYFKKEDVVSISGTLQSQIDGKSSISHLHDDRYYTETELDSFLGNKSDISHNHSHSDLTNLSSDDHTQYLLTDGSRPVDGSLSIIGDLTVQGTQFISNTEIMEVSDNTILVNAGESGGGVSAGYAGVEIDRGTAPNYLFVYHEAHGHFEVGISGSLQDVALREANPVDKHIAYWDDAQQLFVTNNMSVDDVSSINYVDSTAVSLQQNIDGKADIGHTHVQSDITDLVHDATKIQHKPVDAPVPSDDGKRIVYDATEDKFKLGSSGSGGGGNSFPFSYFHHAQELDYTSTNCYERWKTKLEMSVEVPIGTYRIGFFFNWLCTSTSRDFQSRITVDDDVLYSQSTEPKDYHNENIESGFRYTDLTEGTHTIVLEFKPSRSGATIYLWNSELEFWKVG